MIGRKTFMVPESYQIGDEINGWLVDEVIDMDDVINIQETMKNGLYFIIVFYKK